MMLLHGTNPQWMESFETGSQSKPLAFQVVNFRYHVSATEELTKTFLLLVNVNNNNKKKNKNNYESQYSGIAEVLLSHSYPVL